MRGSLLDQANSKVQQMKTERDRFLAFAFCAADAFLEMDAKGNVVFATGTTPRFTGVMPDEMMGKPVWDFASKDDRAFFRALHKRAQRGKRFQNVAVKFKHKKGRTVSATLDGYFVTEINDHTYFTVRQAASHAPAPGPVNKSGRDSQSGLLDTKGFSNAVQNLVKSNDGEEEYKVAVLGLDNFEELKHRMEPEDWNLLQKSIGDFLRTVSADGETAGKLGKESFGLVYGDDVDIKQVEARIASYANDMAPEELAVKVNSATAELADTDLSDTDIAQALIYTVNQFGKEGGVSINNLTEQISINLKETTRYIDAVKNAIQDNSFDTVFMPIVHLKTGEVHHFEALVRFFDNRVGMSPYEFVCFAEDTGLISAFDFAMTQKVIEKVGIALKKGKVLPIAVNLSGYSLNDSEFVDRLLQLLEQHPEEAKSVLFEMTETAYIEDLATTAESIKRLRVKGFHMCLDDFGAGSAAFRYLRELEVDFVKIDGAYVKDAIRDEKDSAFLRAMIELCHGLGIETIAEFVSDSETEDFLKECGVAYGQGFHYGRGSADADLSGAGPSQHNARRQGESVSWG